MQKELLEVWEQVKRYFKEKVTDFIYKNIIFVFFIDIISVKSFLDIQCLCTLKAYTDIFIKIIYTFGIYCNEKFYIS